MNFELNRLVRKNIRRLKPYSSARSEFSGTAGIFLDANENSFGSPAGYGLNRYPDTLQRELKRRIAEINQVAPDQIFVGSGSDEAIDLLFRIFCEPGQEEVIICPPTYGMYEVSAAINDVDAIEVPLTGRFQLNPEAVLAAVSVKTKLIFICSPNNPTGNLMDRASIIEIAERFDGIVVVDEAYIHFASQPSLSSELGRLPNLVVLQTFSKAWGMAGLRVGTAFADPEIIGLLNRVKPPYNLGTPPQKAVIDALADPDWMEKRVRQICEERSALEERLKRVSIVQEVFPSDANFILVKIHYANAVYGELVRRGIVVRSRTSVELCSGCLRITVGTPEENDTLLSELNRFAVRQNKEAGVLV